MASTKVLPNSSANLREEFGRQLMTRAHFEEEKNALVLIVRAALTNAERIVKMLIELLQDGIDFPGPKTHTTGIEYAVANMKVS